MYRIVGKCIVAALQDTTLSYRKENQSRYHAQQKSKLTLGGTILVASDVSDFTSQNTFILVVLSWI